jgi:hypothetical protein
MPGVDGIKSFRALLKVALRRYGLRAIDARELDKRAFVFPSHPPRSTRETTMSAFSDRIRGQKTGVFKVADFAGGREAMLTIDYLEEEVEIFGKVADLLHFTDSRQQLAINQTNAEFLLNTLGDDPEKWKGQRVVLYLAQYEYGNDRGYTIRIKLPDTASKPAAKEGVIIPPARGDGASKSAARSSSSQPDRETDLDDTIPF